MNATAIGARSAALLEGADAGLDLLVTLADELLVVRIGLARVTQREQMFGSPIASSALIN